MKLRLALMEGKSQLVFLIVALSCFPLLGLVVSKLPQEEVDALKQITSTMGTKYWEFNPDTCQVLRVGLTPQPPQGASSSIQCQCNFPNDAFCHVVKIVLKGYNLPGSLPPELTKLSYLKEIDFAYNFLKGTIPREWASLQLTSISLLVNRLMGEIPMELGNVTSLTYLCLEANQFSGSIPSALGNLINLQTLILSSNQISGNMPLSFAGLINMTDLRINDNNFGGSIPNFIKDWKQLNRLEMHASGLEGSIPSEISELGTMLELRISDINGSNQLFPDLRNMTNLQKLVLRNCKLYGEIPAYIWMLEKLEVLDVSFNSLHGKIPATIDGKNLRFIFLSSNLLSGDVPDSILKVGSSVDLSYNNFTFQTSDKPTCRDDMNLHLNLFRSSSMESNMSGNLPCHEDFHCSSYSSCLNIDCGGKSATVKENDGNIFYEGDGDIEGGSAKFFLDENKYWGFSSTGDFMDDNNFQNVRYTVSLVGSNLNEFDSTARIAPISLTYFHYCLENGNYTVRLRFSEIQFTDDDTYSSLGKRIFDIYVQDKLVQKDFNIENEAGGVQKPVLKVLNVSVVNNHMEIRLIWGGKGTTRIPRRGVYGPIISAISIISDSKSCSSHHRHHIKPYIIAGICAACLLFIPLGLILRTKYSKGRKKGSKGLDIQTRTFSLKQLKAATDDFDPSSKIGEGGFGPVYKGELPDGTVIAVKQLSSRSRQGNREFLNEIGMISCLQHPNLVKLYGCCIEGDQLLLVYEYMENNSLARALFGQEYYQIHLDWSTRLRICTGIAKGLAFLHEESRLRIVHRDIKATNVLLDGDLNPKISDFGLARLEEEEKSHVSTKIAGTIGYMAPEYALWGHLSYKADVYSFGVLTLEIVSGRNNNCFVPGDDCTCLLDWACHLQQSSRLMELVDEKLKPELNLHEVETVVRVAIQCTNASASLRPTMSEVVSMLEGRIPVPESGSAASTYREDIRFKALRSLQQEAQGHQNSLSGSGACTSNSAITLGTNSISSHKCFEITLDSKTS
ncbi:hypothetical protein SAY87_031274 [Trapa incisa]|uniref:non-specific serine/threonine protein kinase n=1 Tax=Trapa incisa TaxID=236973 RepID=A0AAN7KPH3_9MYRT|nr:hypothetical protein SAY87_031274 [Trapa incisa]